MSMSKADERRMARYYEAAGWDQRIVRRAVENGYAKWPFAGPSEGWIIQECKRLRSQTGEG